MTGPEAQTRIEQIGAALQARAGDTTPGLFSVSEWKGRIIRRAMENEAFRVALFRFVDVLPAVPDDARAMTLAREYFEDTGEAAAKAFGWGMKTLTRGGLFRSVATKVLRHQVAGLARQFIAGETVEQAIPALNRLAKEGCAISVDLLGEVTVSHAEADGYRAHYLALFDALGAASAHWSAPPPFADAPDTPVPKVNVSVKLSALDPLLDPVAFDVSVKRAKNALRPIFQMALETSAHVHLDMEHHTLKAITLAAFCGLLEEPEFSDGPACGVVLQAYLQSGPDDLSQLLSWVRERGRPVTVRLVKGAYWDQEVITHRQAGWPVPVWQDKAQTDLTFESMTRTLLEKRHLVRPAIAGHNLRSIAHAIQVAEELGIPKSAYEFQVIYGMAEPLRRALIAEGHRVRAYCPVGAFLPGMAYLVRRLLENTANTSMLRRMYGDGEAPDELLAVPVPAPEPETAPPPTREFVNVPDSDFTDADVRTAFGEALERVEQGLGDRHPAVVDGREVTTGRWIESFNPAQPDQRIGEVAEGDAALAEQAVAGAVSAFPAWAKTPATERADMLRRAAEIMTRERHDLAALILFEVGKGWREAAADVSESIDFLSYYANRMLALSEPVPLGRYPGEDNRMGYRPCGVTAVLPPWNFPFAIPSGMLAAALVTGNTVVFKPSERAPVCGARLANILRQAGVPDGVLQLVPGMGPAVGQELVDHPEVPLIAFTGSREVGLAINEAAARIRPGARTVKRVIAEMGGKNAVIVDETADLDEAVPEILRSAFGYQGQRCSACSRVIVHAAVHDALVERLVEAVRALPVGPPRNPANRIGPMIDQAACDKVRRYIDIGKQEGGAALIVDNVPKGYVGPAIFTGIRPEHRLAREEVFGPVLAVLIARDLHHAIEMATDSDFALTGGLFSRSPAAIRTAREGMVVGNLYINRGITGALVGRQPFGGFRHSGVGSKTGGPDYLKQFMLPVTVTENTMRRGFAPPEANGPDR
ncbi:MAG: proline dehydrogenase family protein [Leptospirillia bacterium]